MLDAQSVLLFVKTAFSEYLTHPPDKVRVAYKRRGTISQTSQSNIQAEISTGFHASKA
jgi:hypothetical protein